MTKPHLERALHVHTCVAALLVVSLTLIASVAQATPTQVNVRIEGKSETLFEGPIEAEGHDVRASSDTQPRACDATNNDQHPTPGPTPTSVSVDAMGLLGESFDGQWYPGFDDYFITRWGPDSENAGEGAFWGVLVNYVFTSVGGCQYELKAGDEAMWIYNAFSGRPILALYPTGYTGSATPLTATAELGKPFGVEVDRAGEGGEGSPPQAPQRSGFATFEGADVSPVAMNAKGFEKVETESPATVKTDAQGKASITFTEPGWHRIKATVPGSGGGEESAVRSNRLDVCVPAEGQSACGEPPAEDQLRTPPAPEDEAVEETPPPPTKPTPIAPKKDGGTISSEGGSGTPKTAPLTGAGGPAASLADIQSPVLDDRGTARGLVGVSWRILKPGVGLSSWTIASKTFGTTSTYLSRATGTTATTALVKLPSGGAYELQITFTDLLGRASTAQIGKVLVPHDDRWSSLRYRGQWQRKKRSGAWLGTVSRAGAGGQVSVRLGPGRPVFLLGATAGGAKVEVRAGSRREIFAVTHGSGGSSPPIVGAKRGHASTVSMRVLSGKVDLDGVAVEP
jgi:hypothetical protein